MSVTEEIKSRLDVVAFLSQYIQVKKAGRNYTALCPFHSEKTPSFVIFPESQHWRCFGACGIGGDIFNFLMRYEGVDFATALKTLAEKAGVELQERSPEQLDQDKKFERLRGLMGETAQFFHEKFVNSAEAAHARAYAAKRGLNERTIEEFGIGYAPNDWRQALDHLRSIGYEEQEIVEAGVALHNEEKGSVYDRFRNRLIIPICDGRGQVIAFGGRVLDPNDTPKYLNSPQSPVFDKSATLFGLHNARRTIRESETAVIVEGYMDAIQAHQAGFTNVVAQMGTALTEPQLRQLSRYAKRLILALDADAAGVKATMRGLDVALKTLGDSTQFMNPHGVFQQANKLGIEIRIVTVTGGKDPDDLIRENPSEWQRLVNHAVPIVDYVINVGTEHLTPQSSFVEREQTAQELLPILLASETKVQQHYNVQLLALKLRLDEEKLNQWAQAYEQSQRKAARSKPAQSDKTQQRDTAKESEPKPATINQQVSTLERYCVSLLVRQPRLWSLANRKLREVLQAQGSSLTALTADDFTNSSLRAIIQLLEQALVQDDLEPIEYLQQNSPYDLKVEIERLLSEPVAAYKQQTMSQMLEREQQQIMEMVLRNPDEFLQQVLQLRKQRLKRENQDLYFLQQEADAESQLLYGSQVLNNKRAIQSLDDMMHQMAKGQRVSVERL